MGFSEKYQEYKQRKEAKAFFNQHNTEKVRGSDYLLPSAARIAVTAFLNVLLISTDFTYGFSFIDAVVSLLDTLNKFVSFCTLDRLIICSDDILAFPSTLIFFILNIGDNIK